jgi:TolA-binding protein
VHVQRRDWTAAETALGRAMTGDRFEQLAEAQFLMGIALYEQGRLRDAKAWFEQARTSPSDGGVSDTYLDLIAERSSQRR